MNQDISNSADVIDSRDITNRIEELEDERMETSKDAESDHLQDGESAEDAADFAMCALNEWDRSGDGEALRILKAIANEAEHTAPGWPRGKILIRDSYFQTYLKALCEETGDIPSDLPPYIIIDWERTTKCIRENDVAIDYNGVQYWIR